MLIDYIVYFYNFLPTASSNIMLSHAHIFSIDHPLYLETSCRQSMEGKDFSSICAIKIEFTYNKYKMFLLP